MPTSRVPTMTTQEARAVLEYLESGCRTICEIAKTARRNQKSLKGHNSYGQRFHEAVVGLAKSERRLEPVLTAAGFDGEVSGKLSGFLETLKSPTATDKA